MNGWVVSRVLFVCVYLDSIVVHTINEVVIVSFKNDIYGIPPVFLFKGKLIVEVIINI